MTERLDQEFEYVISVANNVANILSLSDKKIARKWITKLRSYNTKSVEVARSRNDLAKNLLSILRRELLFRVMASKKVRNMIKGQDLKRLQKEIDSFGEPGAATPLLQTIYETDMGPTSFMSIWSADKRTYIACKPIAGEGALVYMAVTPHPELGWDLPDPLISDQYKYPTEECDA